MTCVSLYIKRFLPTGRCCRVFLIGFSSAYCSVLSTPLTNGSVGLLPRNLSPNFELCRSQWRIYAGGFLRYDETALMTA